MYWTDSLGAILPAQINRIQSANLDGSDVDVVVSGVGAPWGIAVVSDPIPEPSTLVIWSLLATLALFGWHRRKV